MASSTLRVASGQITIVDLNDGRALQSYTQASLGDTQLYTPDTRTYTPDYTATPLEVTAKIFLSGYASDQAPGANCTAWKWVVNGDEVTASTTGLSFTKNVLTVSSNISAVTKRLDIRWECELHDPVTQAVTKVEGYKTLTLVQSAGATGMVVIECPDGDTFDRGNVAGTLRAVARLYRGASVDVTVRNPVWEVLDSANGGWRALAAAHHTGPDASGRCTLTVKPSEVLNFQTFRCTLTDSESGEKFSNIVTFYDATDRSSVEVYTLTGNVIKNGQGDTDIYARVWRDGVKVEDIDTPADDRKYTYRWTKYNANGLPENWAGTTSNVKDTAKVPKVTLTAAEVSGKATVHCHVVYTVDFTAALDKIYTLGTVTTTTT